MIRFGLVELLDCVFWFIVFVFIGVVLFVVDDLVVVVGIIEGVIGFLIS